MDVTSNGRRKLCFVETVREAVRFVIKLYEKLGTLPPPQNGTTSGIDDITAPPTVKFVKLNKILFRRLNEPVPDGEKASIINFLSPVLLTADEHEDFTKVRPSALL